MSYVQDLYDTFGAMTADYGTALRLGVLVAVFTFAAPAMFELAAITKSAVGAK